MNDTSDVLGLLRDAVIRLTIQVEALAQANASLQRENETIRTQLATMSTPAAEPAPSEA
jgi:cell division protein FtsB